MKAPKHSINFSEVLKEAVQNPGKILEAYSAFHSYSFGNVMLAMSQCLSREIPFGPIATYKSWESKKRQVRKGEKALVLCMPVSFTKENEDGEDETKRFFTFRANWFVISQTDGETQEIPTVPQWNQETALKTLEIKLVPFNHGDGNVQGYASGKTVAINPVAQLPIKTLFHEMGHVLLGHTDVTAHDSASMPKNLKEVEAESVALLVLSALGLEGAEYCRGYIQSWLRDGEIPESSAKRIMAAADKILKAGRA